jgi:hypothetical protein
MLNLRRLILQPRKFTLELWKRLTIEQKKLTLEP